MLRKTVRDLRHAPMWPNHGGAAMQEQPTWEEIKCEAVNLEIWFGERAGAV